MSLNMTSMSLAWAHRRPTRALFWKEKLWGLEAQMKGDCIRVYSGLEGLEGCIFFQQSPPVLAQILWGQGLEARVPSTLRYPAPQRSCMWLQLRAPVRICVHACAVQRCRHVHVHERVRTSVPVHVHLLAHACACRCTCRDAGFCLGLCS